MQGYREPARSLVADSIVTYYPNGVVGRYAWALVFLGVFVGTLNFALASATEIRVRCDRARGTCSIDTDYPIFGTSSESLPISSITGARAQTNHGKHGTLYRVALVTSSGEKATSTTYKNDVGRVTAASRLNEFFQSTANASIDVATDESQDWLGLALLAVSLIWILTAWTMAQYAKVVVSWRDRTLTIVRVRWPLHTRGDAFPLDAVRDAIVTEEPGRSSSKAAVYGVSLVVADYEKPIPLLDTTSSGPKQKEQAVAEIQKLLRLRDTGGPDLEGMKSP